MDHHRSSHYSPFHHRQSLRPAVGSTMASRYGLGGSSSSSSSTSPSRRTSSAIGSGGSGGSSATSAASSAAAAAMNTGVGITSGVVSFMKKFVSKASGSSSNSIDSSFQKYQQQMQREQQKQQAQKVQPSSRSLLNNFRETPTTTSTVAASSGALHYSDTGYSSNANSPATTPTISPVPAVPTICSPTLSLGSLAGSAPVSSSIDSRPMSAVSVGSNSSTASRGPLFHKIRAKVASTFTASPTGTPCSSLSPEPAMTTNSTLPAITTTAIAVCSSLPSTTSTFVTSTISSALLDAQKENRRVSMVGERRPSAVPSSSDAPFYYTSQSRPPMLSMIGSQSSSLTNEQLTAHLTEEERQILQKVFQKEEEFRELALKNLAGGTEGVTGGRGSISESSGVAPGGSGGSPLGGTPLVGTSPLLSGQSTTTGVSHLSTNLLDPVAAAVHRRRSSTAMSADATGLCRICRKVIMKNESAHRCSNCHELVCDDCSSYSSREESKYWMCSFCRRRGSSLVITTIATSTLTTSASFRVSTSPTPSTGSGNLLVSPTPKRKSSFSEFTRVTVSEKTEQPRQNSLDLQRSFPLVRKASTHQATPFKPTNQMMQNQQQQPIILVKDMTNETCDDQQTLTSKDVNGSIASPNGRPRVYSLSDDEELLSHDEELDDEDEEIDVADDGDEEGEDEEDEEMLQLYNIEKSKDITGTFRLSNTIGHRKSKKRAKTKHTESAENEYVIGGQSHGTLASMPAESIKRRQNSKRRKKKSAQSNSFNSDDELFTSKANEENVFSGTTPEIVFETVSPKSRLVAHEKAQPQQQQQLSRNLPQRSSVSGPSEAQIGQAKKENNIVASNYYGSKMVGNKQISSKWWLLSKKVGMLNRLPNDLKQFGSPTPTTLAAGMAPYFRPRISSESSEMSDQFRYSPPQDSLTPSSEYSRSPRESADSDMLGLTYSSLAMQQRRSIPSVLVDGSSMLNNAAGPFLTLKDCYIRRGSAGRALPNIPVEPSRSMLDLPHSRKSSAHSLDIPMEQPRRASAPEGEGIRIVIDEVGDASASVVASSDSLPTTGYGASSALANSSTVPSSKPLRKSSTGHTPPQMVVIAPSHQTSYQTRMRYQLTRANSIVTHYERVVLARDKNDHSNRTRGFEVAVLGGKVNELDGMLYAYISWVRPGEQAEKAGLKPGDKILEWSGRSLVNCSFEQVANIIDNSGQSVELLVESMVKCEPSSSKRRQSLQTQQSSTTMLPDRPQSQIQASTAMSMQQSQVSNELGTSNLPPAINLHFRPSSAAAGSTMNATSSDMLGSALTAAAPSAPSVSPRRRLPQIPIAPVNPAPVSVATYLSNTQMLLSVTMDPSIRQLSVLIISALGLQPHPAFQVSSNMEAYAQLRLLPEMGFKICKTELSKSFEWNETLIYHSFPMERVDEITLDLSVWCTDPEQANLYSMITMRSPRHSMAGAAFPQPCPTEQCYQLASTRIPLRSALLYLSEWWPLIPVDSYPPPTPPTSNVLDPMSLLPKSMGHFSSSMEYLNTNPANNTLQILNDSLMMSRSTPGSRRGSDRSDIMAMDMIEEVSQQTTPPPNGDINPHIPGVRTASSSFRHTPPTRASSTVSTTSTGGRHSLDDSTYSNTSAAISNERDSASLGRSTSLRVVQNRHSMANLYQFESNAAMFGHGTHLLPNPVGAGRFPSNEQMARRKSSSALNGPHQIGAGLHVNRPTTAAGHHPTSGGGYRHFIDQGVGEEASYQSYLTFEQQRGTGERTRMVNKQDSGSSPSSDDEGDVERLLAHSQYFEGEEADKKQNKDDNEGQARSMPAKVPSPSNKLTVIDNSKFESGSGDGSRYSGTASPLTPLNDDFDDDNPESSSSASNLLAPNWASGGRRSSFLRRFIPSNVGGIGVGGSNIAGSDAIASSSMIFSNTSTPALGDFRSTASSKSMKIVGEIKLSFIMTKGFLEIEVIAARNLPESASGTGGAPDTYVKTYLCAGGRQREKRKTRVVSEDRNPQYRQTLKYDASIIYGRSLLVSVWEKPHKTFESNIPIGAVDINVNQLELHKLTIRWYRLRSFVSNSEMEQDAPSSKAFTGDDDQAHKSSNLFA